MTDPQTFLHQLKKNLYILQERAAKYAGEAPLALLNQIEDHELAISLTQQHLAGELTEADWQERLRPLLIAVAPFRAAQQIVVILAQGEAGALRAAVLERLRQDTTGAVIAEQFEQDPDTFQRPVEKLLAQALVGDSVFAARLKALLEAPGQAERGPGSGPSYQAAITDTGSVAQGPGAKAATATGGGLAIGGDVQGDVNVGQGRDEDE